MFKKKKRYKGRNYHHLRPRQRGGKDNEGNLLLIDIEKHIYWHKIFKNKTLDEVIGLLIRLSRRRDNRYGEKEKKPSSVCGTSSEPLWLLQSSGWIDNDRS